MAKLLSGKITFVAGKNLRLASSVIRRFLEQGATVLVPSQSMQEQVLLTEALRDTDRTQLVTLLVDYPDYYKAFELAELMIERFGKIDVAVFCFDDKLNKNCLAETDIIDWEKMIDEQVTAYFVGARILLSTMKNQQGGMFVSINSIYPDSESCSGALSNLAATMQQKMAEMFGVAANKYRVKWHHISFVNDVAVDLNGNTKFPYSAGDYIIALYTGQVPNNTNTVLSFPLHLKPLS